MSASASLDAKTDLGFTPRTTKFGLLALIGLTSIVWLCSRALLSTNFLPHWYCLVGDKRLLWTTVIADLLIGLSYVAISTTLAWLVRRAGRDLPYSGFLWAFGLFIVSCGVTHFFEIVDRVEAGVLAFGGREGDHRGGFSGHRRGPYRGRR